MQIIDSIKQKGQDNFTYKCESDETTNEIAALLMRKYGSKLVVKLIQPTPPQLKITKLYTDLEDSDEILAQLIQQNTE